MTASIVALGKEIVRHLLESSEILDLIKRRLTKEDGDTNGNKGCSPPESIRDESRPSFLTLIMHPAWERDYQNNPHNKQDDILSITNPKVRGCCHGQDIHQQTKADTDNDNA